MDFNSLIQASPAFIYIIFIWSIFWKGIALWKSSRNDQRNWFIIMLIVNTVGILEILYLFVFSKKKMKLGEFKFWGPK